MIIILRLALVLYGLIMLQALFTPAIAVAGIRPDLPFLLVLLVAFHEGAAGGAICGFIVGLFIDINSAAGLGTTSLANSVIAFGVGSIADQLIRGSVWTRLITAFVATVLRDAIVILLMMPGGLGETVRLFVSGALPGGLYTALLAPLIMASAAWVVRWPREGRIGTR